MITETGQILFLYPQDLTKSFTFTYAQDEKDSLSLGDFFKIVNEKKGHYMEFVDSFGLKIPEHKTIQELLDLQPFYITKMLPKVVSLSIEMLSSGKTVYFEVDIEDTMSKVFEFIRRTEGISEDKQIYTIDSRDISQETKIRDLNSAQPGTNIKLSLKSKDCLIKVIVEDFGGMRNAEIGVHPFEDVEVLWNKLQIPIKKFKETLLDKTSEDRTVEQMLLCQQDQYRMYYDGELITPGRTFAENGIEDGDKLQLIEIQFGGGGIPFADITQTSKALQCHWSGFSDAAKWRIVTKCGLCVEGKCKNIACRAYDQWVIVNKGIGTYDVGYDQHTNKCPMCSAYVKAEKCAFNNCLYGYSGILMQQNGEPPKKVRSNEEVRVGDYYMLFDPKIAGNPEWLSLKIVTRDPSQVRQSTESVCGICKKAFISKNDRRKLDCQHYFHSECLEEIADLNISCVLCHF